MDIFGDLKSKVEDLEVEFEILPAADIKQPLEGKYQKIVEGLSSTDERLIANQRKIDEINVDIERLTNHADGIDYMIAVASGVLTGLIDSIVVGEFDFESAKKKSNKQVNQFIEKYAKLKGYEGEGLKGAIKFLEDKYPVSQDNIWSGKNIGISAKTHHLDDLAHHPTLIGFFASVVVQFFRVGIFVNRNGEWKIEFVDTTPEELLKIWMPVIISGLLNWLVYIIEAHYEEELDEEIPEPIHVLVKMLANAPIAIEVLKVANNWIGHLVSDMGGSKNTAGEGMGIPGLFLSLLKEISCLPILKDTDLPQIVNDLYVKQKFDMRSELAVLNELGRQAIPIIVGEVLVRGFYFVRHLIEEIKEHSNLKEVNWRNIIPFNNRTIARMLTISSGTFIVVDMADAAIQTAIRKPGACVNPATFFSNMILRVNFVGIGRFAIAVGTDVGMSVKRNQLREERILLYTEQIALQDAKVFYKQADMWMAAETAGETIVKAYEMMERTTEIYFESMREIRDNLNKISNYIPEIEKKNPGLLEELDDILIWGE